MHEPEKFDVVIVGGGMVGATLACALGGSALRVAVLEAKEPTTAWPHDSTDLRVSALTIGSVRIFETLGVWSHMTARRVSPFREMHVWDVSGSGVIHFDSADIGTATLGYIVENRVIQVALYERAQEFTNITWLNGTRIDTLQPSLAETCLTTDDGRSFTGRLVVGADGPDSPVRQLAGITTCGWEYGQTAVVAVVKTAQSHQETAWQRFLPNGPLAFLPLSNGESSIVWTTTPEEAQYLLGLSDLEFKGALQTALGEAIPGVEQSLGGIVNVSKRASFPLRLSHASHYVQDRLALIGDAAHTVHPLAGQGVNLGLSDAAVLAEVIFAALAQQRDIGSLATLRHYERWRKGDNLTMAAALEALRRLFDSGLPPLRWLRNWGLQLTNATSPLKNSIMRRAMGLNGDLPKLARGLPL